MKIGILWDLDGTLLGENAVLSEYTRDTINQLVKEGMHFTYASARSHRTASIVLEGLHCSAPAITHNGGFLTDPETGTVMELAGFTPEESAFARSLFDEYETSPFVYAVFGDVKLPCQVEEKMSWPSSVSDRPASRAMRSATRNHRASIWI